MNIRLTIIAILLYSTGNSQKFQDTVYAKYFENFIRTTEKLNKESHRLIDTPTKGKRKNAKFDSAGHYAKEVKNILAKLDSLNEFFGMAEFFFKGKNPASQYLSSP